MPVTGLKINLEAIESAETKEDEHDCDALCGDGVRLGQLFVSSNGLTSQIGQSYVLSAHDLCMVPEGEGGFLGKGSSGSVRRAVHRHTGALVALKEVKVACPAHLLEIRRELETLYDSGQIQSTSLVDFYGAFSYEGSVFIAMECMDGSLDDISRSIPESVLARITRSVLKGLVYLHRTRHLMHRDLKPSNVLFSRSTGVIKISDFGVSSNLECTKGDANSFVGTVTYMSPERLKGDHYSYAADIWSLGLVVAELALGACPYAGLRGGSTEARFWALLQHLDGDEAVLELPATMPSALAHFILQCIIKNPDRRPTCTDLLQHPFITSYCTCDGEEGDIADCDVIRAWLREVYVGASKEGSPLKMGNPSAHARRDCCHVMSELPSGETHPCCPVSFEESARKTGTRPHSESDPGDVQYLHCEERNTSCVELSVNLDDELNRLLQ